MLLVRPHLISGGELISDTIVQHYRQSGLLEGHRFAPGLDGYPLKHQQLLFKIVDNKSIDVFFKLFSDHGTGKIYFFFPDVNREQVKD